MKKSLLFLLTVVIVCANKCSAQQDIKARNITVTGKVSIPGNNASYKTRVARTAHDSLNLAPFWALDDLSTTLSGTILASLDSTVYRTVTTSNTTVTNIDTLPLALNKQITYEIIIHADYTATGEHAQLKRLVGISNVAGTLAVDWLDTFGTDHAQAGVSGVSINVVVSGARIVVQVTGLAAKQILWTEARTAKLVSDASNGL